jgi:hypothetical protein
LLLAKLARMEVDPPEAWSVVNQLEPSVRENPADVPTAVACGLALVSVSRSEQGLLILRRALERKPDDPTTWDAILTGLDLAHQAREMADFAARLPPKLVVDPRFAKHLGRLHQEAGCWPEAARDYRRAWDYAPDNVVGYRLRRALFFAGDKAEAARWDRIVRDYRTAFVKARSTVEEFITDLNEGRFPDPALCRKMAGFREQMGRADEARAWRGLPPGP